MKEPKYKFNTQLIHGQKEEANPENALNPPIFQTSTFSFHNTDHLEEVMSFASDDCVYTRGNNPTLKILEERLALIECGKAAVAFASGMAAISSVLLSLLKPKDKVILHRTLYGSTHQVMTKILPRYQIEPIIRDLREVAGLDELLSDPGVKVIYFETPSNPNLDIIDIELVSRLAHKHDVRVVVDNTFASPYLQQPLLLGADVVVHSATKYICGHGDALGGVAVSADVDYIHNLKFNYMSELGGVLSPFNAWLLLRGLKTLALRLDRHVDNAKKISSFLRDHPKVTRVYYPGFADFPNHEVARRQMSGYGGMISFEVSGGLGPAKALMDALRLIKIAVSLGDCETLIELPAHMTHRDYDDAALAACGIPKDMLRISVGLEDVGDLLEDLGQALGQIGG